MSVSNTDFKSSGPKSRITEGVMTALIVATISFGISLLSNIWGSERGEILVFERVKLGDNVYAQIDITNFSNSLIEDVRFAVDSDVALESITATTPVQVSVSRSPGSQETILIVSQIEANRVSRISFPNRDNRVLRPLNAKEKFLKVNSINEPGLNYRPILISSLLNAGVAAVSIFLLAIFARKQADSIIEHLRHANETSEEMRKNLESDTSRLEAKADRAEKRIQESNERIARVKTLAVARLADYRKELDFWHDCVRALLMKSMNDKSEDVLKGVTQTLQTWHTRASIDNTALLSLIEQLSRPSTTSDNSGI